MYFNAVISIVFYKTPISLFTKITGKKNLFRIIIVLKNYAYLIAKCRQLTSNAFLLFFLYI